MKVEQGYQFINNMSNSTLPDVWGGGQLIAFSGIDGTTNFVNGLCFRTAHDTTGLELMLPAYAKILFSHESPRKVLLTGDVIRLMTGSQTVHGAFLDALHFLIEGGCSVNIPEGSKKIAVERKGNRTLIGVESFFAPQKIDTDLNSIINSRLKWLGAVKIPSQLSPQERRTFSKAVSIMKTQVYTPEGRIKHRWTTPDRWPHRGMWLWDSAFHAIGWRHIDLNVARESIEAVFDAQETDGKIPCSSTPDTNSKVTQPPVLAMAVMEIDAVEPETEWLKKLYPKMCRYIQWDMENRDSDGNGLLEWYTAENPVCRCGESGMDNSPRFDVNAVLYAVDFNSYAALECELLSKIARRIGKEKDAIYWAGHHKRICSLINDRLWDEKTGLYVDCIAKTGEKTGILSAAGFLPLICGAPDKYRAERMARHLSNPSTFGTKLPVPTVAPVQTNLYSKDMWRGPAWINLNWLIARGFSRYGLTESAKNIKEKTIKEIVHCYLKHGTIFEFYDSSLETEPPGLLRKGICNPASPYHQVVHDYGWSAALYVDWTCS